METKSKSNISCPPDCVRPPSRWVRDGGWERGSEWSGLAARSSAQPGQARVGGDFVASGKSVLMAGCMKVGDNCGVKIPWKYQLSCREGNSPFVDLPGLQFINIIKLVQCKKIPWLLSYSMPLQPRFFCSFPLLGWLIIKPSSAGWRWEIVSPAMDTDFIPPVCQALCYRPAGSGRKDTRCLDKSYSVDYKASVTWSSIVEEAGLWWKYDFNEFVISINSVCALPSWQKWGGTWFSVKRNLLEEILSRLLKKKKTTQIFVTGLATDHRGDVSSG